MNIAKKNVDKFCSLQNYTYFCNRYKGFGINPEEL